jgi:microcystin-dependent protein
MQALAEALVALALFVGELRVFALPVVPSMWLPAGAEVLRADYPELFAAVGTTWNVGGEAAASFRAGPVVAGRVIIGAGAGPGLTSRTAGWRGGVESVALTEAQLAAHSHGVNDPGHKHELQGAHDIAGGFGAPAYSSVVLESLSTTVKTTGISIQNAGGNQGHENMQPSVAVLVGIYAGR